MYLPERLGRHKRIEREHFLEEAGILRRADSDHGVRVYDVGEAGGTPSCAMTYADRGSLAGRLQEGVPMLHASGPSQVVGTASYMAPEQAVGIGVDRRADVHALGTVVRSGSIEPGTYSLPRTGGPEDPRMSATGWSFVCLLAFALAFGAAYALATWLR